VHETAVPAVSPVIVSGSQLSAMTPGGVGAHVTVTTAALCQERQSAGPGEHVGCGGVGI
jgi:hypothetical protein